MTENITQKQLEDLIIELLQQKRYSVQKTALGLTISGNGFVYEIPLTAKTTNSSQISQK
jgi:hypothetical protein